MTQPPIYQTENSFSITKAFDSKNTITVSREDGEVLIRVIDPQRNFVIRLSENDANTLARRLRTGGSHLIENNSGKLEIFWGTRSSIRVEALQTDAGRLSPAKIALTQSQSKDFVSLLDTLMREKMHAA